MTGLPAQLQIPASPIASRLAAGALALLLLQVPTFAFAAVGATPASVGVSPYGEPVFVIPVRATPGVGGLAPRLAIAYAGPSVRSTLGVGFTIAGISSIAPCDKTVAQDGASAPILLDASDRYCLDGQRLQLATGTYGAEGATYRTEIDQAMRITSYRPASHVQPDWFKVEMPDGTIWKYGAAASVGVPVNSEQSTDATSSSRTFVWGLQSIADRNGNSIEYYYENDSATQKFRPQNIRYTVYSATGQSDNLIQFVYEVDDRPDPVDGNVPSANTAARYRETKRLGRLDLWAGASIYKRYVFAYEAGAGQNSRLASVTECAATLTDCLGSTTITWLNATAGFSSPVATTASATGSSGAVVLDMNGDGKEDLIYPSGTTMWAMYGSPTGYGAPFNTSVSSANSAVARPIEWDGDGRDDLLFVGADGKWQVARGLATGGLATPVQAKSGTGLVASLSTLSWVAGDFNGDGKDDLVSTPTGGLLTLTLYQNTGSNYSNGANAYSDSVERKAHVDPFYGTAYGVSRNRRPDFNGDGKTDLLLKACVWNIDTNVCITTTAWWRFESQGSSFVNPMTLALSQAGVRPAIGDFNDDDLTDVAYGRSDGKIGIALSTGGGGFRSLLGPSTTGYVTTPLLIGDYDGDHRDDLYMVRNTSGVYRWHVFRNTGAAISTSPIVTTIPGLSTLLSDVDGDAEMDFAQVDGGVWKMVARAGDYGDLLGAVTDGLGNVTSFNYKPMSDATVYTRGSGATFPRVDIDGTRPLVSQMTASDGSGTSATFATTYSYSGAVDDLQGRGELGFAARVSVDNRIGYNVRTEETFEQLFPYTGAIKQVVLKQQSGAVLGETVNTWSSILTGIAQSNQRALPYISQSVTKRYETSGTHVQTATTTVAAIDSTSGLTTDATTVTTEVGTGVAPGSTHTRRLQVTSVFADPTNWCIGKPAATTLTVSHSAVGGAAQSRSATTTWDGPKCRPTQSVIAPGDPQYQVTTAFAFDAFGNGSGETVTGIGMTPRTSSRSYGSNGRFITSATDALGNVSTFTWNAAFALPATATDPSSLVKTWQYDTFGRLTAEFGTDGTSSAIVLGACTGCEARGKIKLAVTARRAGTVAAPGAAFRVTEQELDGWGRAYLSRTQGPAGPQGAAGTWLTTDYRTFDARGRLLTSRVPYAASPLGEWRFTYDQLDRPTAEQLYTAANALDRQTTHAWNGLTHTVTAPGGSTSTSTMTAWGAGPAKVTDALAGNTLYEYNAFGQLRKLTDPLGNITTEVVWNGQGMRTQVIDIDRGTTSFVYNALGEMTRQTDAKSQNIDFTFDALGRPVTRIQPEGTTTFYWGTSAALHNIGQLESVTGPPSPAVPGGTSAPALTESYYYDSAGRLSTRRIVADATYDIGMTYDSTGQVARMDYPVVPAGGTAPAYQLKVEVARDAYGYPVQLQESAPGTAIWWKADGIAGATTLGANPRGQYVGVSLGNGVVVGSQYSGLTGDLLARTVGLTATPSSISNLAYQWATNGNLTQRQDLRQSLLEGFTYDALNRLTQVTLNGTVSLSVGYDALGNITSRSDVGSYTYHPTRKHAVTQAGSRAFTYDANGNMLTRSGQTLAWRGDDLPALIRDQASTGAPVYQSEFAYGPSGERWRQIATFSNGTETTISIGGLLEKSSSSSVPGTTHFRHWIPAPDGTLIQVEVTRNAGAGALTTRYITRDHLGSVDAVLSSTAAVLNRESFNAWGSRRSAAGWTGAPSAAEWSAIAGTLRQGYTSDATLHTQLDNLGLIHMNGRVLDPTLGRFISADPFVTDPFNSQSLNRFSYVLNNPNRFIDPSGFEDVPSGPISWGARWFNYLVEDLLEGPAQRDRANRNPSEQAEEIEEVVVDSTPCAFTSKSSGFASAYAARVGSLVVGLLDSASLSGEVGLQGKLKFSAGPLKTNFEAGLLNFSFGSSAAFDVNVSAKTALPGDSYYGEFTAGWGDLILGAARDSVVDGVSLSRGRYIDRSDGFFFRPAVENDGNGNRRERDERRSNGKLGFTAQFLLGLSFQVDLSKAGRAFKCGLGR